MADGNFHERAAALILLSGLPGAGKTTFAVALAKELNFDHIESDVIRRRLSASPVYSRGENGAVFAIVDSETRKALKAGRHALVDATNLTVKDRARFLDIVRDLGARLVAVRVVAPEPTIRERLSRPREGFSQAGLDVFERVKTRTELIAAPVVVVDTRFDLAPSVRSVVELVVGRKR